MFKHTQSSQAHTGTHPSLLGTVALFLRQHLRALHRILNSWIKQLLLWQEKWIWASLFNRLLILCRFSWGISAKPRVAEVFSPGCLKGPPAEQQLTRHRITVSKIKFKFWFELHRAGSCIEHPHTHKPNLDGMPLQITHHLGSAFHGHTALPQSGLFLIFYMWNKINHPHNFQDKVKSWLVTCQNRIGRIYAKKPLSALSWLQWLQARFFMMQFPRGAAFLARASPHLCWRNSGELHRWIWLFMCNLLLRFCPENFVLYFSTILLNSL